MVCLDSFLIEEKEHALYHRVLPQEIIPEKAIVQGIKQILYFQEDIYLLGMLSFQGRQGNKETYPPCEEHGG